MKDLLEHLWRYLPKSLRSILKQVGATSAVHKWLNTSPPYEPDVCGAIERIVQSGWICADVGAHVGIITQLLAKLVGPDGLVVAFEAHPENVQRLRKIVKANSYTKQVRVENLAVSDGSCDRLWLYPGRAHSSAEWNIVGHDVEGKSTEPELEVPAISLDEYFATCQLKPNLVKIDVEGAEALVLAGMRHLLREVRPVVVIEFHNEVGWDGRKELFAAGYHLYDMSGRRVDPVYDVRRIYHCLALPSESTPEACGDDTIVRGR